MKLWRLDLDRLSALFAPPLAGLEGITVNGSACQSSDLGSLAIVTDGSRWGHPVQLVAHGDIRHVNCVLIIDDRTQTRGMSSNMKSLIAKQVARCDVRNIGRLASDLANVLGPEFSFALINTADRRLALVRDPIGSRPLYWRRDGSVVSFSSSRESLLAAGPRPEINEAAVAVCLGSGSDVWSRHELLAGFHRVPHGGYAFISQDGAKAGRWWAPQRFSRREVQGGDTSTALEVRALLEAAVASRIEGAHAVAAHVSGGIDSTGVAAIGARQLARAGRTLVAAYAWSPPVSEDYPDMGWRDERRRIEAFAAKEGVQVRFGGATAEDFVAFLTRPIETEGTADLADEMPILQLAQADGVEVMLSGWGGDEVFSSHGFGYLAYLLATLQWDRAVRWMRAQLRTLRQVGPVATTVWWQAIHPMLPDFLYRLFDQRNLGDPQRSLIAPDLLKRHRDEVHQIRDAFRVTSRPTETMFRHFMAGHITHRIESWDVWSKHYGFSYTYPLTDARLIERLLAVSPEQHFPGERKRGLALASLADALPAGVNKFDYANEANRQATRQGAWRILARMEREGQFQKDCPWIDMQRFREQLSNPLDQKSTEGVLAFLHVFNAVRVWHMWVRQGGAA